MQTIDNATAGFFTGLSAFAVPPFEPRRFLGNGHLQTIVGNFLPREDRLPEPEAQLVVVNPATDSQIASQVLCHCHWQPVDVRRKRLTVILLHGLEGSSNSQYIVGNSNKLWSAGMNIIRMNMRNCGGTEHLSPTLYHSGLSNDVRAVMDFFVAREGLERVAVVGYSMGGNVMLKFAGEEGVAGASPLKAAVGVSPAVDLGPSADLLHRPANWLYERRFMKALKRRYRKKAELFPSLFDPEKAEALTSLRQFDDQVTAFYSGFSGADDYYFRAAAARVLESIAVPTLILHADDDPFVHITRESREKIAANPHILMIEPRHGGHCAFLGTPNIASGDDGYWAETALLRFLRKVAE